MAGGARHVPHTSQFYQHPLRRSDYADQHTDQCPDWLHTGEGRRPGV
jgi:hypothetical protein